jgi:hypothetical protein
LLSGPRGVRTAPRDDDSRRDLPTLMAQDVSKPSSWMSSRWWRRHSLSARCRHPLCRLWRIVPMSACSWQPCNGTSALTRSHCSSSRGPLLWADGSWSETVPDPSICRAPAGTGDQTASGFSAASALDRGYDRLAASHWVKASSVGHGGPSRSTLRSSRPARLPFGSSSYVSHRQAATIASTSCRHSRSSP